MGKRARGAPLFSGEPNPFQKQTWLSKKIFQKEKPREPRDLLEEKHKGLFFLFFQYIVEHVTNGVTEPERQESEEHHQYADELESPIWRLAGGVTHSNDEQLPNCEADKEKCRRSSSEPKMRFLEHSF